MTGATTTIEVTEEIEIVEGSWQDKIVKSNALLARGTKATAKAGTMLWEGAQAGILDWLEDRAEDDVNGEGLYNEIVGLLGKPRRGDAHKIKMVALAVKDHGLVLSQWEALSKAWKEAKRLIVDVQQDKDDDHAADEAVQALAVDAPKTATTAEGAAKIVLKDGVDEAVRLLLDALNGPTGENNTAAHRAFLRAVSQEISGRQPKPEPAPAKAATVKGAKGAKAKPAIKSGAAKEKAVKANPKSARKTLEEAQVESDAAVDDLIEAEIVEHEGVDFDEVLDETDETPEVPVKKAAPVKAKARPVVRRS